MIITYTSDGHICTDIEISFGGKSKVLRNVVIDTGAVQSILCSETVAILVLKLSMLTNL